MTNILDIATFYAYAYQRNQVGMSAENMVTIDYPDAEFWEELLQDESKQALWAMQTGEAQ